MQPGMLHALIIRSPHGHARIRGIDALAALALSGMAAVIAAQHIEEAAQGLSVFRKSSKLKTWTRLNWHKACRRLWRQCPVLAGFGDAATPCRPFLL